MRPNLGQRSQVLILLPMPCQPSDPAASRGPQLTVLGAPAQTLVFKPIEVPAVSASATHRRADQLGFKPIASRPVLLTLSLSPYDDHPLPTRRTLPSQQAHRVEFLVVATELTGVVITGCNLGAQGEHQHTDGSQPHKDAPAGEKREERGWEEEASGQAASLELRLQSRKASKQTHK